MTVAVNEETGTKRELRSTKRELRSTKRELDSTKRELRSTKQMTGTAGEYWDFGAPGDYLVTTDKEIPITASCIRVLARGDLNILTDTGRWFVFAAGAWKSVQPRQPYPETLEHMVREQVNLVLDERGDNAGWKVFEDAHGQWKTGQWKKERGATQTAA